MLRLALLFFVIALIAALLNVWPIVGISMEIARILLIVFVILAILSLVGGIVRRPPPV